MAKLKQPPSWTDGATISSALLRGVIEAPSVPAVVLFASFLGFGALAREFGLTLGQSVFVTVSVWALPGQVVMVDELAKGAFLAAAALAVTLTAVRLLPLVATLIPYLRDERTPLWLQFWMSHYMAITVWVESMRRLPPLPRGVRVPYYLGFATSLVLFNIVATIVGYELAAAVPRDVAAMLLFLTPIYFFLSLIAAAQGHADRLALLFGLILGPVFYLLMPGIDLMITGLVAGTLAYGGGRWLSGRQ